MPFSIHFSSQSNDITFKIHVLAILFYEQAVLILCELCGKRREKL